MFTIFNSIILAAGAGAGGGGGGGQGGSVPPFDASSIDQLEASINTTKGNAYLLRNANLSNLINNYPYGIVGLLFFFGGIALILNLILAGIGLMMAAGDPAKVKAGQERIKNGFLGLLLMLMAYFIIQLIGLIFNLPGITATFS